MGLRVCGHTKEIDYVKLGPSLLIATCLIVAIRTAKWNPRESGTSSTPELDKEIAYAVEVAGSVMAVLTRNRPNLFQSKDVPWYFPDDEAALH